MSKGVKVIKELNPTVRLIDIETHKLAVIKDTQRVRKDLEGKVVMKVIGTKRTDNPYLVIVGEEGRIEIWGDTEDFELRELAEGEQIEIK